MNYHLKKTKRHVSILHICILTCIMALLALVYNAKFLGNLGWLSSGTMAQSSYTLVLSFLFLIPILYTAALFRFRGLFITWGVFLAAVLPRAVYESSQLDSILKISLFVLVALLCGILVADQRRPPGQSRSTLKILYDEMLVYVRRILKEREYERQRVVRELHDNTIQSLLVVANHLYSLEMGEQGRLTPEAKKQVEHISVMVLHIIDNVRRLSNNLRPSILDNVGLIPALKWQAERLTQEQAVNVEFIIQGKEHRMLPEVELLILRIAQEALSNISKHSGATRAVMAFDFGANTFKMTVRDNGRGFVVPQDLSDFLAEGKSGLCAMQQRTQVLNGVLSLDSQPGKGCVISVDIKI